MKETIYTIPINEAFEVKCGCPLCTLRRKLEHDSVGIHHGRRDDGAGRPH